MFDIQFLELQVFSKPDLYFHYSNERDDSRDNEKRSRARKFGCFLEVRKKLILENGKESTVGSQRNRK